MTQSLADAARDLLANVDLNNDNNGTFAALQAALDAHDKPPTIAELLAAMTKASRVYFAAPSSDDSNELALLERATDAYHAADRDAPRK